MRSHSSRQGKPWNNWAMFDLSNPDSETPMARNYVAAHIKCVLDFSDLPEENALVQPPGIYAIIEPSRPNADKNEIWWSELFDPIHACRIPAGFEEHNRQELVLTGSSIQQQLYLIMPTFE